MRIRVCMTDHVHRRIEERGGDPASVAAAARRAARAVMANADRPRKIAVDAAAIPEVIPVVLVDPRRRRATVKTVLPPTASSLRRMEVVCV